MLKRLAAVTFAVTVMALTTVAGARQKSPGAGPIVVLETVKGTIEFGRLSCLMTSFSLILPIA